MNLNSVIADIASSKLSLATHGLGKNSSKDKQDSAPMSLVGLTQAVSQATVKSFPAGTTTKKEEPKVSDLTRHVDGLSVLAKHTIENIQDTHTSFNDEEKAEVKKDASKRKCRKGRELSPRRKSESPKSQVPTSKSLSQRGRSPKSKSMVAKKTHSIKSADQDDASAATAFMLAAVTASRTRVTDIGIDDDDDIDVEGPGKTGGNKPRSSSLGRNKLPSKKDSLDSRSHHGPRPSKSSLDKKTRSSRVIPSSPSGNITLDVDIDLEDTDPKSRPRAGKGSPDGSHDRKTTRGSKSVRGGRMVNEDSHDRKIPRPKSERSPRRRTQSQPEGAMTKPASIRARRVQSQQEGGALEEAAAGIVQNSKRPSRGTRNRNLGGQQIGTCQLQQALQREIDTVLLTELEKETATFVTGEPLKEDTSTANHEKQDKGGKNGRFFTRLHNTSEEKKTNNEGNPGSKTAGGDTMMDGGSTHGNPQPSLKIRKGLDLNTVDLTALDPSEVNKLLAQSSHGEAEPTPASETAHVASGAIVVPMVHADPRQAKRRNRAKVSVSTRAKSLPKSEARLLDLDNDDSDDEFA